MGKKNIILLSVLLVFIFFNMNWLNPGIIQMKKSQSELEQEVTITLKLVQVYVTDKKGNPITDLEKEDFELKDNGKRQNVTDFERHILSSPTVPSKTRQTDKTLPPPGMLNRKFFLFFDFAFNNAGGIDMAKRAALHFLDTQVNPNDEVSVLSYSSHKGIVMHEYLTVDHSKVREIVLRIGVSEALGRAGRFMEELESDRFVGIGGGASRLNSLKAAREEFIRLGGKVQYKHEAQTFASIVKDMAKAFRYIPGYKHIILFSTGIPDFLMYPRASSIKAKLNTVNLASSDSAYLRTRYERMGKELKASNSSVHTVNVEGIYKSFMEREGETHVSLAITKKDQPSAGVEARDRRGVASLRNLADETGGKYFDNINNYKQIVEDIHHMTSCYYVLGYVINEKWDGKHHKIEVKAKRPGCKVYGQSGYFNPKPFGKYSELEKKLHLVDLALSERPHFVDPVHFPVITLPYSVMKESYVLVLAKINSDEMKEVLGGESEIIFLTFDERKDIVGYRKVELDDVTCSQNNIFCYTTASLSPGTYDFRVVIRNGENGRGAAASSSVSIPGNPELGLRLYPPLVLIPEVGNFNLDAASSKKIEEGDSSIISDIYPFDMTQYSPLAGEVLKNPAKLLVITRCSLFGISTQGEIKISAQLMHLPTQTRIPLSITSGIKYHYNNLIIPIVIQSIDLSPGRYYMYIFAEEMDTGIKSSINTMFVVE